MALVQELQLKCAEGCFPEYTCTKCIKNFDSYTKGIHKGENDLLQVYANERVYFHLRTQFIFKMSWTNQILTSHNKPAHSN